MSECMYEFIEKIKYLSKIYSEYERHSMDIFLIVTKWIVFMIKHKISNNNFYECTKNFPQNPLNSKVHSMNKQTHSKHYVNRIVNISSNSLNIFNIHWMKVQFMNLGNVRCPDMTRMSLSFKLDW